MDDLEIDSISGSKLSVTSRTPETNEAFPPYPTLSRHLILCLESLHISSGVQNLHTSLKSIPQYMCMIPKVNLGLPTVGKLIGPFLATFRFLFPSPPPPTLLCGFSHCILNHCSLVLELFMSFLLIAGK